MIVLQLISLKSNLFFLDSESSKMAAEHSKMATESSRMATESSKMAAESSKMAARLVPERIMGLDDLDKPSGILHVWFLLLEGMSGAVSSCPREFQPKTMEMLFELLRASSQVPGLEFNQLISSRVHYILFSRNLMCALGNQA